MRRVPGQYILFTPLNQQEKDNTGVSHEGVHSFKEATRKGKEERKSVVFVVL
jgi:hypothetical protein